MSQGAPKARVLVVDDERNMRTVLRTMLRRDGYEIREAGDGIEALEKVRQEGPFHVVVTDLKMPGLDGMELLEILAEEAPETAVVILTAHGSVDSAVRAVKKGAFDYIEKPFDREHLRNVVRKAAATAKSRAYHARPLPVESDGRYGFVGRSPAMLELYRVIERVADTPSTVLVTGESGTGKELVARALHRLSSRRTGPFVAINCGAIPPDLMESELFGHEKGAFTGAVSSKPGRFELAHGGTLFLDEVAEIPIPMQVKLLRVLQTSEFERVGGIKTIHVDVRVVAATNRDLDAERAAGRFRDDLYYRLAVVPIHLTPLRERPEDLELLVEHFLAHFNEKLGRRVERFSRQALEALKRYPWPGNIRELENLVERVLLFADGPVIHLEDLPERIRRPESPFAPADTPLVGDLKAAVRQEAQKVARRMILDALDKTNGNISQAARLLGLSRKGLQLKMKELGLRHQPAQRHQ